ncbi:MAG: hypothetical protein JWO36_6079 [Myxococcales bacterium]|nr:hypothetical protein [Myxococcales bacterium]
MSDPTRDGDDDPQLRSLRAIWLALPDEEPPQSGLAQLIAAARVQAEHMGKPSVWHRVFEMLRRPGVLALATIIVLIGGALFISRRSDQLESAPATVSVTTSRTEGAPVAPMERERAVVPEPEASAAVPGGAPGVVVEEKPPVTTVPKVEAASTVRVSPPKPAAPIAKTDRHAGVQRSDLGAVNQGPASGRANGVVGGLAAETAPVLDDNNGPPSKPYKAPMKKATKAPAMIATDDVAPEPTSQADLESSRDAAKQPEVAQLLAQCRSAATRGDCAAVRAIAQRIAKQNAVFYRDRVSKDAMITKCLLAE